MRRLWCCLMVLGLTGCSDTVPPAAEVAPPASPATRFDPANCGAISGTVRWSGPVPTVPLLNVERFNSDMTKVEHLLRPNPHAPQIGADGAVAGVVVFLRGVDPVLAKPWDHPAVTVEYRDNGPIVRQGDAAPGLVGIVRRGDAITLVNKELRFQSARARGAAFFTLTLPEPDLPRQRTLNELGRVELSSASGDTHIRGHLFVTDHPYYAVTAADGRFQLSQVPAGEYELVIWRANPAIARTERDPESLLHVRLLFGPPLELTRPVTIEAGVTREVTIGLGAD